MVSSEGAWRTTNPTSNTEGVLSPTRPPLKGMPRINTFPGTDGQRKRLHVKSVKVVNTLKPTVRHVTEIVPQHMVAKLPPATPR